MGYISQNSFPDVFDESSYNVTNGVPPPVNDYILSLPASDALMLGWQAYNVGYSQLYLKYQLPISLKGFKLNVSPGVVYVHEQVASFGLKQWNSNPITNTITSYTPQYSNKNIDRITWTLGLGMRRDLSDKIYLEIDAKYIQDSLGEFEVSYGLVRFGVGRKF